MDKVDDPPSPEWDSQSETVFPALIEPPALSPRPTRQRRAPSEDGISIFPPLREVGKEPSAEDEAATESEAKAEDETVATDPEIASFFAEDPEKIDQRESFHQPGAEKVGIIGGKGVGKSYLFQALVYRAYAGTHSGAMSYFLETDAIRLFSALKRKDRAAVVNLANFVKNYENWIKLPQTLYNEQKWYRLRLQLRNGLLGNNRSTLDVEYFDGSGEGLFEAMLNAQNAELWSQGYLDARVMVFCLPLWVAFPGSHLSDDDWLWRDRTIEGFESVVQNFLKVRELGKRSHPVSTILALTMADDPRGALDSLRRCWIDSYKQAPYVHIKALRTGAGLARYLANARKVSEKLYDEFLSSRDPKVAAIPQKLDLGVGRPWLVPVSAIDGTVLEQLEEESLEPGGRPRRASPVPIHVELPLMLALAERENALM